MDFLALRPFTLAHLFELVAGDDTPRVLRVILDKCPSFLQDYYAAVPDYEDGLRFVDYAYEKLKIGHKPAPAHFMRWDICLISLKLEMLDRLGRWEQYRDFFRKIYAEKPHYRGKYRKNAAHLRLNRASPYFIGEDERYYYAHFLYLLLPRYEAVIKNQKARAVCAIADPPDAVKQVAYAKQLERLRSLLGLNDNILERQQKTRP